MLPGTEVDTREVHGGGDTSAGRGPVWLVHGHAASSRRSSGDGPGARSGRAARGGAGVGGVGTAGGQPVPPAACHAAALAGPDGAGTAGGPRRTAGRGRANGSISWPCCRSRGAARCADGDERFETVTARRPVLEAAVAAVASRTPGVTIRRGVAVTGLLADSPARARAARVRGVLAAGGRALRADLVVDCCGLPRRWRRGWRPSAPRGRPKSGKTAASSTTAGTSGRGPVSCPRPRRTCSRTTTRCRS